jgi:23S rRNA pseudouridine2605 synthase
LASRTEAALLIEAGRVSVNGRQVRDPEMRVKPEGDCVTLDGAPIQAVAKRYIMLNKPRGLVTSRSDEQGRATVYSCFEGTDLGWLAPVGRLDKASEGLLLFTNDTAWADRILSPTSHLPKVYHVQIGGHVSGELLLQCEAGVEIDGAMLKALRARLLRHGEKNAWLEITLDEGKNRHIRRMLEALDIPVLRLVRVAVGPLALGSLGKGEWRELEGVEVEILAGS